MTKPPPVIRLYCATGNRGKLREFRTIAEAMRVGSALASGYSTPRRDPIPQVAIELVPGYSEMESCVEDGDSFGANAMIKARHYGVRAPGPLFADDSGLVVDALSGAPGVYSARYSGPDATDESNNRLLLERLHGAEDRAARFVCVIALAERGRVLGLYGGQVDGVILEEPRGSGGFGYDPLFYYPPFGCTFGEASEEQKSEVSHRAQAMRKLIRALVPLGFQ